MSATETEMLWRPKLAGKLPPLLRFDVDDVNAASEAWNFNCGPGALAAVLSLTPEEVRKALPNFPGYTSVTGMQDALRRLGRTYREAKVTPTQAVPMVEHPALMRIQWDGPWMAAPKRVHACYTHWVALWPWPGITPYVFDVNGTCAGWLPTEEWTDELVPWLFSDMKRKPTGWHPTHVWELVP